MKMFYELKGLILSRCQMPGEFLFGDSFLFGLSQEGAYTSRCQMPELFQNKMRVETIYIGDGLYTGDHTKSFGSMD